MTFPAIQLKDVTKRYGSTVALDDISLSIERGQIYGLLGPNGAGKSTLLDLLVGFRFPTAGCVRTFGFDPTSSPRAVRSRIGILPDGLGLHPRWTGRRHLQFVVESHGTAVDPSELATRVDLADVLDRSVDAYSKGMRQRLTIAMALAGEPDLLILDEPSTGLDPDGMRCVREIVKSERDRGTTILFSSHRLAQVESVAERVGVLVDGVIVDSAHTADLRNHTRSVLRITTVGEPPKVDALRALDGVTDVRRDGDGLEVVCDGQATTSVLDAIEERGTSIESVDVSRRPIEEYFERVTT